MKITQWLTAVALSSMIVPAAMAKSAPKVSGSATVKVHVAKKASMKRGKRIGGKMSKRRAKTQAPALPTEE
jgi:hypothetical protein